MKDVVVVRIAEHELTCANTMGDRCADRDIGSKTKHRVLEPILPADDAVNILKPRLMHNQSRLSSKHSRNQTAQADVVLKKQIAPAKQTKDFGNRRTSC